VVASAPLVELLAALELQATTILAAAVTTMVLVPVLPINQFFLLIPSPLPPLIYGFISPAHHQRKILACLPLASVCQYEAIFKCINTIYNHLVVPLLIANRLRDCGDVTPYSATAVQSRALFIHFLTLQ
jgi:hypothetical protein